MTITETVLNAAFTGIGVAIGTYIAQKHLIQRTESILKRLEKKLKDMRK